MNGNEIKKADIGKPDSQCCKNCRAFDPRTGFCRALPPQVVLISGNLTSKFPKIEMPNLDYCEHFEQVVY